MPFKSCRSSECPLSGGSQAPEAALGLRIISVRLLLPTVMRDAAPRSQLGRRLIQNSASFAGHPVIRQPRLPGAVASRGARLAVFPESSEPRALMIRVGNADINPGLWEHVRV